MRSQVSKEDVCYLVFDVGNHVPLLGSWVEWRIVAASLITGTQLKECALDVSSSGGGSESQPPDFGNDGPRGPVQRYLFSLPSSPVREPAPCAESLQVLFTGH